MTPAGNDSPRISGTIPAARRLDAVVHRNEKVSSGLLLLEVTTPPPSAGGMDLFLPGQFAMLNLPGERAWTFGRPLSILAWEGDTLRFLYRVVGRGTAVLESLETGAELTVLGPLGRPFPADLDNRAPLLIAGGVGLPPVWSWLARYGDSHADVRAMFGARDRRDAPWPLLDDRWTVAVEELPAEPDPRVREGLVTQLVEDDLGGSAHDGCRAVLACGPTPMLKAVQNLCERRGWTCWLSLEEHMGCGYGVCKGCVVPVRDTAAAAGWRPATCCHDGPVFAAGDLAWELPALEGL